MKYRGNAERQVALLQPFRPARQLSQPCSGRGGNDLRTRIIILAGVTDRAGTGGRTGSFTRLALTGHAAKCA
jgi:hypothetical protein